jgi:glycosyltransferase involved in cell wall biosynthesis
VELYIANVEAGVLPERGWALLRERGHEVWGNWAPAPFRRQLDEVRPDAIVYAPHGQRTDLPWRRAALELAEETMARAPTVLWALYPDYLTGWDHERQQHQDGFAEPVRRALPLFRALLANSEYTQALLAARAPRFAFEVCYPGIDTQGIDAARGARERERARTVLWHHRWSTDKNLLQALGIIEQLALRFPEVECVVGHHERWDDGYWSPRWLRDAYAPIAERLRVLPNVRTVAFWEDVRSYWRFLGGVDVAFSCSFHESFGIGMLEQAYAGAACVVPARLAYPEVHGGALVVADDEIEPALARLIAEPAALRRVAASSRAAAAAYPLERTVAELLRYVERARG